MDGEDAFGGAAAGAARGVLSRKLRPRAPAPDMEKPDWARRLPRAVTRAISAGAGLSAEPSPLRERRVPLAELLERIAEDGLVLLLARGFDESAEDHPEAGVLVFDGPLFTALVEALTLGRLGARTAPPRRPTVTDAALLTELASRIFAEALRDGGDEGESPLEGWHIERAVPDLRLLPALLPETGFQLSDFGLELVDGEIRRRGVLALALPAQAARLRPGLPAEAPADTEAAFAKALHGAALGAQARIEAVLGRLTLPLGEALQLSPGMLLELPLARLEGIELVGQDGSCCAEGRLGQAQGMRAIRLTALSAADPE